MPMLIHYPNSTHRILDVSPGLIFRGLIFGRISGLVCRWGLYLGGVYVLDFMLSSFILVLGKLMVCLASPT